MTESIVERAILVLREVPAVTLSLRELARRLDVDVETLRPRVADDPRLLILEPTVLPDLTAIGAERKAAYRRALRAAGLLGVPRVALTDPVRPEPDAPVDALLRHTATRLLTAHAADLADAAERANRAVRATLVGGAARSTIRLPRRP